MARKWIIKRYKEDPIYCSQTVGEAVRDAWKAGVEVIDIPGGKTLAASSISAVEETTQRDDDALQLGAGEPILPNKPMIVFTDKGDVAMEWWKKPISMTEWEKYYSKHPFYWKLLGFNNETWIAMRLPQYTGDPGRSPELEQCTEDEIRMLSAAH